MTIALQPSYNINERRIYYFFHARENVWKKKMFVKDVLLLKSDGLDAFLWQMGAFRGG
jgi:hypothetical protein